MQVSPILASLSSTELLTSNGFKDFAVLQIKLLYILHIKDLTVKKKRAEKPLLFKVCGLILQPVLGLFKIHIILAFNHAVIELAPFISLPSKAFFKLFIR